MLNHQFTQKCKFGHTFLFLMLLFLLLNIRHKGLRNSVLDMQTRDVTELTHTHFHVLWGFLWGTIFILYKLFTLTHP